jgi:hypothetical protein
MATLFNSLGIMNFYDAAARNDFFRQNLFRITQLGGTRFTQDELLYATSTTLPQRAINNIPVPFMGLQFNVPGAAQYPNSAGWNVTFRVPQNLSIRRKLEDWTYSTFNDINSTGEYSIPNNTSSNIAVLSLLDKQGGIIRTYTLYGCYCVTVGEMQLNITSAGEISEIQATIAYQYWRLTS